MVHYLTWFTTLCAPIIVACVSVDIDGIIDLGPNWNYEYQVKSNKKNKHSYNDRSLIKLSKHTGSVIKSPEAIESLLSYKRIEPSGIYGRAHIAKEDKRINDFSFHVYKQSMKVFDEIKKKVNPALKDKVDYIARSYDERFRLFINETLDKKIKTRLGPQKVVSNVIDTSNRLLKRLVNFFIGDMNKEGILRNNMDAAHVFQKEVDMSCDLEWRHACTKFDICRTSNGFSDFLIGFFTIIIKSDDGKIKQASDALTEVVKNTDFSKIMDAKTQKNFQRAIELVETFDIRKTKAVFIIVKNVLVFKDQPINVMSLGGDHVNRTVAFLEIVDELDKQMPPSEEYLLEWLDIKNSLYDWSIGHRDDILEIMQAFVTFLKKNGIDRLNSRATRNVSDRLAIIFH